ncbi:BTAD domain-containing putative transcriptional regulator [Streptomyces sp. XD-27]|uniref:AfsR/SARP family transcriptional regulator n=1 Tax=Streptomyces sp. XD-27 TaxID=3062779 RepID=UPI0026F44C0F|nr:BTAD domain-containing putative transcriptional regulator [Streptomyces sp. XD-27]WKX71427.1 BTAD domain-containing putative transcriptional regulator [Streptomyces sp. XD-27]
MEFALLGPVTVATGRGELPLGPPKRRSVLAMLLLQPNTTLSVEQLTASLWEDEPPAHARTVIQGHVSKLRAALSEGGAAEYGVELTTHGSAYLLRLPESLVDAHRFGELAALARPETAPEDAVGLLREALSLWRGPALTGTVSTPPFAAAAHALEERRLAAVTALATAYGTLGEHDRAAAALSPQAVAHPLREGLVAALMLALYRAGRQSDAIEWYHRTRRMLADELGVDPGERLRDAYEHILAGDRVGRRGAAVPRARTGPRPGTADGAGARAAVRGAHAAAADAAGAGVAGGPGAAGAAGAGGGTGPGPHGADGHRGRAHGPDIGAQAAAEHRGDFGTQTTAEHRVDVGAQATAEHEVEVGAQMLPRAPAGFFGRGAELERLTRFALPGAVTDSAVVLVTGPAGVGKTALAVRWAHAHARAFPHGRLFADLRGFSAGQEAEPAQVLRDFLLALGVEAARIPESVDAAAALYRSLSARRALLVVLDNARSSAQVRPLLPVGPHCVTLVTSRSRLDGLVATDSARAVPLRALGPDDGVALLGAVLGPDRVAEDPVAAQELVGLCNGLPLALRAAAAQLTARPRWRLARLAAALRDERRRLALLSAEDTGVAAALRASVARLSADDARLLATLGSSFAREVDVSAVAEIAGSDPELTRDGLGRLAEMHLIDEEATDRYVMSDLVKLFAQDEEKENGR